MAGSIVTLSEPSSLLRYVKGLLQPSTSIRWAKQLIARRIDEGHFMVAGLPIKVKG